MDLDTDEPRYAAGTIVARNYLAQARILARSFRDLHPEIPFHTLVIDGNEVDRAQPGVGTVLLPTDLGIAAEALESMMLVYDVTELATALKPALLAELLLHNVHAVAYFDPDIRFYGAIPDVFESARADGIVLTPHSLYPIPRDGLNLSESAIMHAGIYNLGFIAVGAQSFSFLAWWHERLRVDAIVDFTKALFTDQRWIDWVPSLFPHTISRDQGLNAAYWNMHERPISEVGGEYRAGNAKLRFFHFSGYDPELPWLLSKHLGDRPRTLLSEEPVLNELCDGYRAELEEFEHTTLRREPYRLGVLPTGLPLTSRLRRALRELFLEPVAGLPDMPPPFSEPEAFAEWLMEPSMGSGNHRVSVAQWSVWRERADVQAAFPDPLGAQGGAFLEWCAADPGTSAWLAELATYTRRPVVVTPSTAVKPRAFGWSVVAYANAELGVGEAGRRAASAVLATGLPMEIVGTRLASRSRQLQGLRDLVRDSIGFENVLSCVNADILPQVSADLGLSRLRGRHIGLWFWELDTFPPAYWRAFDHVHEVWVASEFTRSAIQAATSKPVRTMTLPIEPPLRPTRFTRRSLGLPNDSFLFLTNFDYYSVYERKNPIGVIKAYSDAFGPDDGATLVVKSINGRDRPLDREHVRSFARGRPDILFLDDYVSAFEMRAMIELSDCFVSLHRAEGYGLNLADAFAVGTPAIATGYSGNLAFMTDLNSILVGYKPVEVGPNAAPYDPIAQWADPDLHAAAAAMRAVFDDRAIGERLSAQALADVRRDHSLSAAAGRMEAQLLWGGGQVRSA